MSQRLVDGLVFVAAEALAAAVPATGSLAAQVCPIAI